MTMQKNYEEYLRSAKETLEKIQYLTPEDRKLIERGVEYLERGHGWLKSDDPETLRNAASLMMIGGYYLGARCAVSDSEAEYWRRKKASKGGSRKSRDTQAWKDWATQGCSTLVTEVH